MAVVASGLLLFHYLVIALNFRAVFGAPGTAAKFLRLGFICYLLVGLLELLTAFRGVAVETQFTFLATAMEQLGIYGGLSMMFFGAIYYMVPRLTGRVWASAGLMIGHRFLVIFGVVVSIVTLAVAGWSQAADLLNAKAALGNIFSEIRLALLIHSGAQIIILAGNFLLFLNFCRSACACQMSATPSPEIFRQPATLEAHAS
jgi:cytochrome c oxidase cbb3-type subunit 1